MNAKEEFLKLVEGKQVKCAEITHFTCSIENYRKNFILKIDYDTDEYNSFVNDLDFEYDDEEGDKNLYGIIWFLDNSWAERYEHDGVEWWVYKSCPKIPDELKSKRKVVMTKQEIAVILDYDLNEIDLIIE